MSETDGLRMIFEKVIEGESTTEEGTRLYINPTSTQYEYLSHFCSIESFYSILDNMTFRATRLNSLKMNDLLEAKRKNIEHLAGAYFISSFTHCQHEIVPFWMYYGGAKKENKVRLRIKNFAMGFEERFFCDYCLASSGQKLFFDTPEHEITTRINGIVGRS